MTLRQVDVAVVGAGPVGVALANLLGQRGLTVAVFERDAAIYPMPRAIHFDGEVMRVFETMGLRAEVEAISRPGLQGMHFVNADGRTLLIRGGTAARGPHGCASNHYFHQPELEAVLRAGLARYPSVQLHLQHAVMAVDAAADGGATLSVSDLARGEAQAWQARWLVGCDGARSLVRRLIGTPMHDLGLHQPWLVFDVLLHDDVPGLPDHTVQHCDPVRPMTYCHVTGRRRRWEIMLMPGDDPAKLVRPEHIWPLVARWLRPDQADIERAVIYTFHSVIAAQWRRGALLLAGDAAHQTPPFLGQGLCAGIRDAANLAWKLDAVQRGRADDQLLDSYGSERAPHVHAFIDLAVKLGAIIQTTDPDEAQARDARFTSGGAPETFSFPAPLLGPGAWLATGAPVAQIFAQPRLDDGRLLDTAIDRGAPAWALIARPALLASLSAAAQAWLQWHGVTLLPATDAALQAWLEAEDTAAVLLRPDRYVAGTARDGASLAHMLQSLPAMTTPACG